MGKGDGGVRGREVEEGDVKIGVPFFRYQVYTWVIIMNLLPDVC